MQQTSHPSQTKNLKHLYLSLFWRYIWSKLCPAHRYIGTIFRNMVHLGTASIRNTLLASKRQKELMCDQFWLVGIVTAGLVMCLGHSQHLYSTFQSLLKLQSSRPYQVWEGSTSTD
jgi:hypothetical protein